MHYGMGMGRGFRRLGYQEENLIKPNITKEFLIRILKYFIPFWKQILLVFLTMGASAVLGLVPPLLTKNIIDQALPQKNMGMLILLTLASFGTTLVSGLISVAENYLNTWISRHIIQEIRNKMYAHLQTMSLKFFSTTKPGEVISVMNNDINGIQGVFSGTFMSLVNNFLVLIFTAAALISMNWKLAIVGMFVIPLFIIPTREVGKVRWKIASETHKKLDELNQVFQETLNVSGAMLMKLFTNEKKEYNRFHSINQEVTRLQIKESLSGRWFFMVLRTFSSLGPIIIYFYGGYLYIKGELSVGDIIAFITLLGRLYGPVTSLSNIHVDLTRSMALFERIFHYFDLKPDITDSENAVDTEIAKGCIQFENVSFSYNDQQITLHDLNFTIQPGQLVALVGPSGAGKTSVTYLIPRLYDVTKGNIYIDGVNIKDIKLESLRSQIGFVTQDTFLFNTTIKENLLYSKPDATDEEIVEACKAAYIHDFIMSLPEGYETVVGERGIKLSGGEKQRISIARTILKNPKIIILDEATSSLDSVSESLIQKAIEPLLKNRTSLVIAHRLSTIMSADLILVLKDGQIVESGPHHELLKKNGLYKELYDKQFGVR